MGIVGSRPDDGSTLFIRDPSKFSIAAVTVTNARNQIILRSNPDAFPATRYTAQRDLGDDTPMDFVQDIESSAGAAPSFLLRLAHNDELTFNFVMHIRQPSATNGNASQSANDTQISSLTFISGSTAKEVENIVVREFHADPNIHKSANVHLLGDYTTGGSSSVQISWTWKWQPPKPFEDKGNGWRNSCSFVEYDQRTDKLSILASFNFWVQNTQRYLSTGPRSPRFEMTLPPRLRVPSSHSIESRFSNISDSEGEATSVSKESREPQSPIFQTIPEDGLGLVTTNTNLIPGPVKVDVATVKHGEDLSTNEDGPLFRATMRSLEQRTGNMRMRMKRVLRTAEAAQTAQMSCNNAVKDFTEALREASTSNANAVQPALDHYFEKIAREILLYEMQNTANLYKLIIDPISKLYTNEIKQADFKKREFDEESKEYYAYTSKYLGQRSESVREKKQKHTDEKYQAKRRTFELKRFDYSSFMHDLHGGRKDQEVLSQLTKYADAQARGYLATAKKVEEMMPQLEALISEVRSAEHDYQIQRTEREEKRRVLEKSTKLMSEAGAVVPTGGLAHSASQNGALRPGEHERTPSVSAVSAFSTSPPSVPLSMPNRDSMLNAPSNGMNLSTSPSSKFKGIRDLEDNSATNAGTFRKEGLLWSLSRPSGQFDAKAINKQGWHKFWIVLDQGRLSEYVNWKDKLDLHMDPIDLRMASVREARSSERRFCFEVITPQFTRVYQAPSEEDMKAWIGAVNNALQSAFEAKTAVPSPSPTPHAHSTRKDIAAVLTGKSTSFHGHRQASNPNRRAADSAVHRHATTGDRPGFRQNVETEINLLLQRIRNADEGNKLCADCGSDSKVDWCSINLGILLCIECSGIHRSLGTHISKVRSLTLDTSIFTPDIVEVLLLIGNRVSNMVWEAKLDRFLKPAAHSTREQRLHFITAKYGDRAYVVPNATLAPDDFLLTSIKRNDIHNVLQALALRANPNAHDRSRSTHAVYLALAAADPASPAAVPSFSHTRATSTGATTPQSQSRPTTPSQRKPFPVAELLLQNGADVPSETAPIPLSTAARLYLDYKADLKAGRVGVSGVAIGTKDNDTAMSNPISYANNASPNVPSAGGIRIGEGSRMLKRHSRQSIAMSNDSFEGFGKK